MNSKNNLIVCIICGTVIALTGTISFIISRDTFTVFIIIFGLAVTAGGIIYYFIARRRAPRPETDKAEKLTDYYIELYEGFAARVGRQKVFKRKLRKLKSHIFEVCLDGIDVENRTFAVYLYYVYGMEKLSFDKAINCLADILAREENDGTIDNLPEGMTLCDLVARTLTCS